MDGLDWIGWMDHWTTSPLEHRSLSGAKNCNFKNDKNTVENLSAQKKDQTNSKIEKCKNTLFLREASRLYQLSSNWVKIASDTVGDRWHKELPSEETTEFQEGLKFERGGKKVGESKGREMYWDLRKVIISAAQNKTLTW